MSDTTLRKNPSRKQCEDMIRRILITEVLEHGSNRHFKNAGDFMSFFESLYPASESLTKQVQRAIKAMDMPKDEYGFYVINKTKEQLDQDKELSLLLKRSQANPITLHDYETFFLAVEDKYKEYLLTLIEESTSFTDKYITILTTSNGLLFYTHNANALQVLVESLCK